MKDRSENILLRIPLIMINIPIWLKKYVIDGEELIIKY